MTNQLNVDDITVFRGERCLFEGLSFSLGAGGLVVLEGANGSGKTSLLRALAGILDIDSGTVRWNGTDIRDDRQGYCEALVWMAHRVGFKADLTLVENLRFEAVLRPSKLRSLDVVLERLDLTRLVRLPVRALSAGQQRRVALARMLLASVPLWLMDEPFTNLDRGGRRLVKRLVGEHVSGGGLCILAAHEDVRLDVPTERLELR